MNLLIALHDYVFWGWVFLLLFDINSLISQAMVILAFVILYDDYKFQVLSAVVLQCMLVGYFSAFLLSLPPLESLMYGLPEHLVEIGTYKVVNFFPRMDYFIGLHAHKDAFHICGCAKMLSEGIDFRNVFCPTY